MSVVIYSARTGRIRRIVIDDVMSDKMLLSRHPVGSGEASHLGPRVTQEELNVITGLVPTDDRYAAYRPIDGVVTHHFIGDLACGDGIQGRRSEPNPSSIVGWRKMRDDSWERSLKEIENDLINTQAEIDLWNSQEFRDREAADPDGLTEAEMDAHVAALEVDMAALEIERTARLEPQELDNRRRGR